MLSLKCRDCGGKDTGYMIHDGLWYHAGLEKRDYCCRPCLSKRIGRPLTNDDYAMVPLNFMCVPEFCTEDNYRLLYAKSGLDYDKTKAEYFERCERLGLENRWDKPAFRSESSQTLSSDQSAD